MNTNNAHQTQSIKIRAWMPSLIAPALITACAAFAPSALADDNRAPEVPDEIAVSAENKVHFHGFGVGVQIYTWNGSSWGAPVPEATLFDNDGNVVIIHFAGPTWQSNSGSQGGRSLAAAERHRGPQRHPVATARGSGGAHARPRHPCGHDLYPAREHDGRQSALGGRHRDWASRPRALYGGLLLLPKGKLMRHTPGRSPAASTGKQRPASHGSNFSQALCRTDQINPSEQR